MVELIDLSQTPALQNTHPGYLEWSKMEIVREMKEDFLMISDEFLQ